MDNRQLGRLGDIGKHRQLGMVVVVVVVVVGLGLPMVLVGR